jgi:hypothetical protein
VDPRDGHVVATAVQMAHRYSRLFATHLLPASKPVVGISNDVAEALWAEYAALFNRCVRKSWRRLVRDTMAENALRERQRNRLIASEWMGEKPATDY